MERVIPLSCPLSAMRVQLLQLQRTHNLITATKSRGTRSPCMNAATLALADAGIPMRVILSPHAVLDTLIAHHYLRELHSLFGPVTRSDLNYVEDSADGPDPTVGILPKLDKVILMQMDAWLPLDIIDNVMQLVIEGCKAVADYIKEALAENSKQLAKGRSVSTSVLTAAGWLE